MVYTCYVGICVWNSTKFIPYLFNNLKILISTLIHLGFDKPTIIFAYSPSSDSTLSLLKTYNPSDANVIILTVEKTTKLKTVNISNARNHILQHIRSASSIPDYFMMLDANYVNYDSIDSKVLSNALKRDDWDAISFNRNPYYDIWALSLPPYCLSSWHWSAPHNVVNVMSKFLKEKLDSLDSEQLLPCLSAFNGFAIYRTSKFDNCFYNGYLFNNLFNILNINLSKNIALLSNVSSTIIKNRYLGSKANIGSQDCEHRFFHIMAIARNKARIRISPLSIFFKN